MTSSVFVLFRRRWKKETQKKTKKREQNLFFMAPIFIDTEENTYSDYDLIGMIRYF